MLGNKILEFYLVIKFLKKDILVSLVIKLSPEYLINRNPLRLDLSTIYLKDIIKAIIIKILINKNIIEFK